MRIKFNPHDETKKVWDQKTRCDFCQQDIPRPGMYEKADVNLSASVGETYPEGDASTTHELDCCVTCFMKKVKPLIEKEFGVKFRERDSDDFKSSAYVVEQL